LRELGLTEILFDPPPVRPVPPKETTADDEDDHDPLEAPLAMLELPPPPPLPSRPLTEKEVLERLEWTAQAFPTPESMLDAFENATPELWDSMDDWMPMGGDFEFEALTLSAEQLWYMFFPPGTPAPPGCHWRRSRRW
jgi:hypothetical protein